MVTKPAYDDLIRRWERWLVDTNTLFADSDRLGVPVTNSIHYLWNDLRVWVEGLPSQIRSASEEKP
jgi:hypothetical protein